MGSDRRVPDEGSAGRLSLVPPKGTLSRRRFVAVSGAAATTLLGSGCAAANSAIRAGDDIPGAPCTTVPDRATAERPDPQENWRVFSAPAAALAFRNHGMLAELLREPITPLDPNARWNRQGMGGNGVQTLPVTVRAGIGDAGSRVPSNTQLVVPGADVPPPSRVDNSMVRR